MTNIKVLVVDDSTTYLEFTKNSLEGAGYQVITSTDAWISGIMLKEKPNIVLMDLTLRSISGVDAINALKNENSLTGYNLLYTQVKNWEN